MTASTRWLLALILAMLGLVALIWLAGSSALSDVEDGL